MSSGPDGYLPYLFKYITDLITVVLAISVLSMGRVPTAWKIANIMPFYKKGDFSSPCNYCPVLSINRWKE